MHDFACTDLETALQNTLFVGSDMRRPRARRTRAAVPASKHGGGSVVKMADEYGGGSPTSAAAASAACRGSHLKTRLQAAATEALRHMGGVGPTGAARRTHPAASPQRMRVRTAWASPESAPAPAPHTQQPRPRRCCPTRAEAAAASVVVAEAAAAAAHADPFEGLKARVESLWHEMGAPAWRRARVRAQHFARGRPADHHALNLELARLLQERQLLEAAKESVVQREHVIAGLQGLAERYRTWGTGGGSADRLRSSRLHVQSSQSFELLRAELKEMVAQLRAATLRVVTAAAAWRRAGCGGGKPFRCFGANYVLRLAFDVDERVFRREPLVYLLGLEPRFNPLLVRGLEVVNTLPLRGAAARRGRRRLRASDVDVLHSRPPPPPPPAAAAGYGVGGELVVGGSLDPLEVPVAEYGALKLATDAVRAELHHVLCTAQVCARAFVRRVRRRRARAALLHLQRCGRRLLACAALRRARRGRAAAAVQACARGWAARAALRRRRAAAACVQAAWRGHRQRRAERRAHEAAGCVQGAVRRWLRRRSGAARVLQAAGRAAAVRRRTQRAHVFSTAASVVQRVGRAAAARAAALRARCLGAAATVRAVAAGWRARRRLGAERRVRRAGQRVSACFAGYAARVALLRRAAAAAEGVRVVRHFLGAARLRLALRSRVAAKRRAAAAAARVQAWVREHRRRAAARAHAEGWRLLWARETLERAALRQRCGLEQEQQAYCQDVWAVLHRLQMWDEEAVDGGGAGGQSSLRALAVEPSRVAVADEELPPAGGEGGVVLSVVDPSSSSANNTYTAPAAAAEAVADTRVVEGGGTVIGHVVAAAREGGRRRSIRTPQYPEVSATAASEEASRLRPAPPAVAAGWAPQTEAAVWQPPALQTLLHALLPGATQEEPAPVSPPLPAPVLPPPSDAAAAAPVAVPPHGAVAVRAAASEAGAARVAAAPAAPSPTRGASPSSPQEVPQPPRAEPLVATTTFSDRCRGTHETPQPPTVLPTSPAAVPQLVAAPVAATRPTPCDEPLAKVAPAQEESSAAPAASAAARVHPATQLQPQLLPVARAAVVLRDAEPAPAPLESTEHQAARPRAATASPALVPAAPVPARYSPDVVDAPACGTLQLRHPASAAPECAAPQLLPLPQHAPPAIELYTNAEQMLPAAAAAAVASDRRLPPASRTTPGPRLVPLSAHGVDRLAAVLPAPHSTPPTQPAQPVVSGVHRPPSAGVELVACRTAAAAGIASVTPPLRGAKTQAQPEECVLPALDCAAKLLFPEEAATATRQPRGSQPSGGTAAALKWLMAASITQHAAHGALAAQRRLHAVRGARDAGIVDTPEAAPLSAETLLGSEGSAALRIQLAWLACRRRGRARAATLAARSAEALVRRRFVLLRRHACAALRVRLQAARRAAAATLAGATGVALLRMRFVAWRGHAAAAAQRQQQQRRTRQVVGEDKRRAAAAVRIQATMRAWAGRRRHAGLRRQRVEEKARRGGEESRQCAARAIYGLWLLRVLRGRERAAWDAACANTAPRWWLRGAGRTRDVGAGARYETDAAVRQAMGLYRRRQGGADVQHAAVACMQKAFRRALAARRAKVAAAAAGMVVVAAASQSGAGRAAASVPARTGRRKRGWCSPVVAKMEWSAAAALMQRYYNRLATGVVCRGGGAVPGLQFADGDGLAANAVETPSSLSPARSDEHSSLVGDSGSGSLEAMTDEDNDCDDEATPPPTPPPRRSGVYVAPRVALSPAGAAAKHAVYREAWRTRAVRYRAPRLPGDAALWSPSSSDAASSPPPPPLPAQKHRAAGVFAGTLRRRRDEYERVVAPPAPGGFGLPPGIVVQPPSPHTPLEEESAMSPTGNHLRPYY